MEIGEYYARWNSIPPLPQNERSVFVSGLFKDESDRVVYIQSGIELCRAASEEILPFVTLDSITREKSTKDLHPFYKNLFIDFIYGGKKA